jgi:hypothetical protein
MVNVAQAKGYDAHMIMRIKKKFFGETSYGSAGEARG